MHFSMHFCIQRKKYTSEKSKKRESNGERKDIIMLCCLNQGGMDHGIEVTVEANVQKAIANRIIRQCDKGRSFTYWQSSCLILSVMFLQWKKGLDKKKELDKS